MKQIEELYRLYFKDIFLFVKAISKDEHIAEEITQESFFKAIKSINSFKGECDIRVWLCQIAKNTYYTYCKKNKCIVPEEEIETNSVTVTDDHILRQPSIETQLLDKEQAITIHKILHKLDEPYKEVFNLRTFGELSFKEIGKVFGKTESWSRVTYHRAKMRIIESLDKV